MSRSRLLTAAVLLAAVGLTAGLGAAYLARAEEPAAKPPAEPDKAKAEEGKDDFTFVAHETFNGKFGLHWRPVRPDATHLSLAKHPGYLTITTQRGTIHGDANAHGEPFAKNIFVMPNPLTKDTDFVMTTCVSNFTPTQSYQQAALICYDDDANYVKWSYEYDWRPGGGNQYFILVREIGAKPEHFMTGGVAGLKKVWLRLTKRGNKYEYSTSTDGKEYQMRGEQEWGEGAPKMLGILAKNGGPEGVPEIDAQFDFFDLRSPAPPKAAEEKK